MRKFKLDDTTYYYLETAREFFEMIDTEQVDWDAPNREWSELIPEYEQVNIKDNYDGPGFYEIIHFFYNVCDYGFDVKKTNFEDMKEVIGNFQKIIFEFAEFIGI